MIINQFLSVPSVVCWRKAFTNRVQLLTNHLERNQQPSQRFHSSASSPSSSSSRHVLHKLNMRIVPVPVRTDNYAYLIIDEKSKSAAVVDPFDPEKVIKAAEAENVSLSGTILTTHHHQDHSGGNQELVSILKKQLNVQVYGGSSKIPGLTNLVQDGTKFMLLCPSEPNNDGNDQAKEEESSIQVSCLATPCHTRDSICFHVQDILNGGPGSVFTGDTLFNAGCGRFFEGTAEEMERALNQKLGSLPNDTITYNGHEYTKSNIAFAKSIEPENPHVLELVNVCAQNDPVITTGKYTIGDEKKFNPFMRLGEPSVLKTLGLSSLPKSPASRIQAMEKLRELKNLF